MTIATLRTVLCTLACFLAIPTFAADPKLQGVDLKNAFQTNATYTLRARYSDADGDGVKKATFVDESRSGEIKIDAPLTDQSEPEQGVTITWEVKNFDKGAHKGYFLVLNDAGQTVRYPTDKDSFYEFKVESISDKWIIMGVGLLICLGALPFLVYLIARSINKQGNPSSAARIGLIIGIVALLALFLYEFVGVIENPLIFVLAGIAAIALFIIVLTRR